MRSLEEGDAAVVVGSYDGTGVGGWPPIDGTVVGGGHQLVARRFGGRPN